MKHTTRFYLKEPNAPVETLIYAIMWFDNKPLKLSTGMKVAPRHWNAKKQRVRTGSTHEVPINDRLVKIGHDLTRIVVDLLNSGIRPSPSIVKEQFTALVKPAEPAVITLLPSLLDLYEMFIQEASETKQQGEPRVFRWSPGEAARRSRTIRIYRVVQNHLRRFCEHRGITVTLEAVDRDFFEDFSSYLSTEAGPEENKGLNANTVWNIAKNLKAFLKAAHESGLTANDAYRRFSQRKHEPKPLALTREELQRLHKLDLRDSPALDNARNLFCLQCYLGVRISDLRGISAAHIKDGHIELVTVKTSTPVRIPLTTPAKEILARFPDGNPRMISDQRLNEYIKTAAARADIDTLEHIVDFKAGKRSERTVPKHQLISSHTARRTFITLSLEQGMRPEALMPITGHKDLRTLQRYIGVTDNQAAKELRQAWNGE